MKLRATLIAGVLAASSVAFGVVGLGEVDAGSVGNIDTWKLQTGDYIDTDAIGSLKTGIDEIPGTYTDNIAPVANLEIGSATDIMFQRREGTQLLDGVQIDAVKDYAFVGNVRESVGFTVVDVTDPRAPEMLSQVSCGGFHNDIVVWENYVVVGNDSGSGGTASCEGNDGPGTGRGIAIYDVTDPANPEFVRELGESAMFPTDKLTQATHNISLNPETGHVYYSTAGFHTQPRWGAFPLDGNVATNESVEIPMGALAGRTDGTAGGDGCHDQGLAFDVETAAGDVRDFIFCAAIETTIIWDITDDPLDPVHVATIANPSISIHHGARLAPDGHTLVLNDELAGAAAGVCTAGAPTGTLFAYDISVPEAPVPVGYGSTDELNDGADVSACTSHFYNFISPEQNTDAKQLSVTGWYRSGAVVHDFTRPADVGPVTPSPFNVHARATPDNAAMWTAYGYRGYVYSASYNGETGFFVYELDGYTPEAGTPAAEFPTPLPFDEGTSWSRWTQHDA